MNRSPWKTPVILKVEQVEDLNNNRPLQIEKKVKKIINYNEYEPLTKEEKKVEPVCYKEKIFCSRTLDGMIEEFDIKTYIGKIKSGNEFYEIIIQPITKLKEFPKGYPFSGDKVTFLSQMINGKLYASNIVFIDKNKVAVDNTIGVVIEKKGYIYEKGVVVVGRIPKNMSIHVNDKMELQKRNGTSLLVTVIEISVNQQVYTEAVSGDYAAIFLKGILSEMEVDYKDILRHRK